MATLEQLEEALRRADAAGNVEDATALAKLYADEKSKGGNFVNSVGRIPAPNPMAEGADPTEGMSGLQRFVAGYGKSYVDTGRGIQQLLGVQGADDAVNQSRKTDAALMDTTGGTFGNITGSGVQLATPIPGSAAVKGTMLGAKGLQVLGKSAPYLAAAAKAGTWGGLQGVADGESRGENVATNAALATVGQAIPGILRVGAKITAPAVRPVKDAALATLDKWGIPTTVSQVADSRAVKLVASALNHLPFSGAAAAGRRQIDALNRAAGRLMGVGNVTRLTDDVMNHVTRTQDRQYNTLLARNTIDIDKPVIDQLNDLMAGARRDLEPAKADIIVEQVKRFAGMAKATPRGNAGSKLPVPIAQAGASSGMGFAPDVGKIPGRVYQNIRLDMRKKIESQGGGVGAYARDLRKIMEGAANKSFNGRDAALWKELNQRFANRKLIESVLKQNAGAFGDLNPGTLWRAAQGKYGATQDMRDLARASESVLKNVLPDSYTAQRNAIYKGVGALSAGTTAAMAGLVKPLIAASAIGASAGRLLNKPGAARIVRKGVTSSALNAGAKGAKHAPILLPALYGRSENQ